MREIHHFFEIDSTAEKIFEALTQEEHIKEWWTNDCHSSGVPGSKAVFRWKDYGWTVEFQLKAVKSAQEIVWTCTQSNMQNTDAWVGTTITYTISRLSPSKSRLEFRQTNYKDSVCYQTCWDGWNYFLGKSLKGYLETGQGFPYRSS